MTKETILSILDKINKVFQEFFTYPYIDGEELLEDFEVQYEDDYLVLNEGVTVYAYDYPGVTVCTYGHADGGGDVLASYRYLKPISKGYRFDWLLESLSKRFDSGTYSALEDAFRATGLFTFRVPNMEC